MLLGASSGSQKYMRLGGEIRLLPIIMIVSPNDGFLSPWPRTVVRESPKAYTRLSQLTFD